MPYPNYHAARVKSPALFSRIVVLKTLPNGIMIYGGPLKSKPGGSSTAQAYRFPRTKFTATEARKWLKDHDIKYILFEKASGATQAFNVRLLLKNIKSFNQNKIIELIPQKVYDKIIEKDPHPFFAMYSICHEGISAPVVLNEGPKKIAWPRKAVQSIKNIFIKGVRLFKGHNLDNSHSGRKIIGRVIHSFQREIEGKLHHIVITYHPPSVREEIKNYDVCSQEAEWNFFDYAGQLVAESIEKLTGIALADSDSQAPAFSGAKRLGYVQAFEEPGKGFRNIGGKNIMAKKNMPTDQDMENIFGQQDDTGNVDHQNQDNGGFNYQNIPQNLPPGWYFIPAGNNPQQNIKQKQGNQQIPMFPFNPNFTQPQNFQQDQKSNQGNNKKDNTPLTYEQLKNEVKRMKVMPSQLFSEGDLKADREFVPFFNELQMAVEDNEKKDKRIEELMREKELGTAKERITNIISEDKLPEPITNFIFSQFGKTKEQIEDLSDQGLKSFVKSQTELFQETAKIVNPEFDIKQKSGDDKKGGNGDDVTKAENNELLDEDYEE
jgi:hypothetical protein